MKPHPFLIFKIMIDDQLTKDINAYLDIENKTDLDIINAAGLLLRIDRNRNLYLNIIKRPQRNLEKLNYELNKHLAYRMDGKTLDDVRKLDKEVIPEVEEFLNTEDPTQPEEPAGDIPTADGETANNTPADGVIPPSTGDNTQTETPAAPTTQRRKGMRDDHDSLPEEIKQIWTANIERYKKIKEAFETCKTLDKACDRYEYLILISEEYKAYRDSMYKYDHYVAVPTEADAQATAISSARAYISKNRQKLDDLIAANDTENASQVAAKIQDRVNVLLSNKAEMSDDLKEWLTQHEFTF